MTCFIICVSLNIICIGYDTDIEERLMAWSKKVRQSGGRLTGKALRREWCVRLHRLYGNQSFKASSSWYRCFKGRNTIVMRTTHISQKSQEVAKDLIMRFIHQNE